MNEATIQQTSQSASNLRLVSVINKLMLVIILLVLGLVSIPLILYFSARNQHAPATETAATGQTLTAVEMNKTPEVKKPSLFWTAPDPETLTDTKLKEQVAYGRDLIVHTAQYLGPQGSVAKISNGMNCQNCHLQAGTAVFGNNYGSVASQYPKLRARSGTMESIEKRVNDCFERSLNGKTLDDQSKEMQSIKAYMVFLGKDVPKGEKAAGSGFKDLDWLERAANPEQGKTVYQAKCASCHQPDGQGQLVGKEYVFPPLWGPHSYNDAAGLFRLSNFARYVKYNMPQGSTHENPQLSDEEAWDLAAFVNTQPRPHKNTPKDWPDISKKPVDHPFGPYADAFTEKQHKYGPFKPILAKRAKP